MGMFDKDKEIGLQVTEVFATQEEFILWAVSVEPQAVQTDYGMADRTTMTVSKLSDPLEKFDVNTLGGAIADKAKEANPDEFPAVVYWLTVPSKNAARSDATVLRFVREYAPPRQGAPTGSRAPAPPSPGGSTGAEDDIPF